MSSSITVSITARDILRTSDGFTIVEAGGGIVTITGMYIDIKSGSLKFGNKINNRSTCSLTIPDEDNAQSFKRGQPISIGENAGEVRTSDGYTLRTVDAEIIRVPPTNLYSGYIETADKVMVTDNAAFHRLKCTDMHYLADKRRVAIAEVTTVAGDIVKEIVDSYLVNEGVSYTADSIEDGQELPSVLFNYIPASQALDKLAESSYFWWRIDHNKVLYFKAHTSSPAPFELDRSSVIGKPTVKIGNPLYRNTQWITGGTDLTATQTEIESGDGEKRTFIVGFEIAAEPTVSTNIAGAGYVGKTVGVLGVDTGKDFYYEIQSKTVSQDSGGTVLTAADLIKIEYVGRYEVLGYSEDTGAIDTQADIEGTSGIVEDVVKDTSYSSYNAVVGACTAKLQEFAIDSASIKFKTRLAGLQSGQLLTINDYDDYGIATGEKLLIVSVTSYDNQDHIYHNVEAVKGPRHRSWGDFFKELSRQSQPEIKEGIGESGSVIIPHNFSRTWTETERLNIFHFEYPATDLRPADDLYPCFNTDETVLYLAAYNGGAEILGSRKQPTAPQTGLPPTGTPDLVTVMQYATYELPGEVITSWRWIGTAGVDVATMDTGSGVVVDEQADVFTKTNFETVTVTKTDIKDW